MNTAVDMDGSLKGFPTSYSLTQMPTGKKLAEHIVAKCKQGTPILNDDTFLAYGKLKRSTFRSSI